MSEFDSIRPYNDDEVVGVVERLLAHPDLPRAGCKLVMPSFLQGTSLGGWLTKALLTAKTRDLRTVLDCQLLIAQYMKKLVDDTTAALTVGGLEHLDPGQPYLFMSNHRDITMDSSLMNYLLHENGFQTSRMAVGDNLLHNELAADIMRLNKSFVVERDVIGARATLKVLVRTSDYIKQSIEDGVSIWIAQREGRAKDGWDRTDPALLKMLSLAHKETGDNALHELLRHSRIVPVAIAYEIDPCAPRKAHELAVNAREGAYEKGEHEDLESIVAGIVGYKGRVHIQFNAPLAADVYEGPEALAAAIDERIMNAMRIFPTYTEAARRSGQADVPAADVAAVDEVMLAFEDQCELVPADERDFLLLQYANVLTNLAEVNGAARVADTGRAATGEAATST